MKLSTVRNNDGDIDLLKREATIVLKMPKDNHGGRGDFLASGGTPPAITSVGKTLKGDSEI